MNNSQEEFKTKFWEYYLSIEEDFLEIEKVVPTDHQNFDTFSVTYMKILFSICSEVDVLLKEYIAFNTWYKFTGFDSKIDKYREIIKLNKPRFCEEVITFTKNLELTPFATWSNNENPVWWRNYNALKHGRTSEIGGVVNYKKATQKNVLDALGALYQIEMYFFQSVIDRDYPTDRLRMPVPQSKRYRIKDWTDNVTLINNSYIQYINLSGHLILEGEL